MNLQWIHRRPVLAVLLLGATLRIIWALLVPVAPVSDSRVYEIFARSLAAGNGYAWHDGSLTSYWPPGTSFVYALFFKFLGEGYTPIVVFHLFVGVAVVYLGHALASLFFDRSTSLLSAVFLAVWPMLIQFTTILSSELLFMLPILVSTLLVFGRWRKNRTSIRYWVTFGGMIGVAAYIRPTALPLLVILPVLAALRYSRFRQLVGWILVGGIACLLLIAPWVVRNTRLYGEFTTISTNFGPNLWMGNNPYSQGTYQQLQSDLEFEDEKERDDYYRREAIEFITANPLEFLRLAVMRTIATFDRETIGIGWNLEGLEQILGACPAAITAMKVLSTAFWYFMVLLSLAGVIVLARAEHWRISTHPLFMLSLFFAAIPIIVVGQDRYHMPMIPMIAILAAHGGSKLVEALKRRSGAS